MLHTEFRDGNIPAGYQNLRVLKEALGYLPDGVKKVRLRSDNAGYQHDLLKYCETGKNKMKAIRYRVIHIPARILNHSRELIIQLRKGHPSFALLKDARLRIMEMRCVPVG